MKTLDKKEFIRAWNNSWNHLHRLAPMMLALFIIFTFASGILTWYNITYLKLAERSLLLKPLFDRFGIWTIFAYDFIFSIIFLGYYKLTKKHMLLCTIPILAFYALSFINFLNDFGFAFNIIILQNMFQKLGLDTISKILGG